MNRFSDLSVDERGLFVEQMRGGQYYLLLGSGISLDSTGMDGRSMRSAGALRSDLSQLSDLPPTSSLQQAYSLLTPAQISHELTKHYSCREAGQTVSLLAERLWRRIYTLNIDNCYESVVRNQSTDHHVDSASLLQVHHFKDDYQDISPNITCSLVHLHGTTEQPEKGYVFSHEEYARTITRSNSWMLTLTQLLRSEPFVVAGTSLEEIDVSYYLEQRSPENSRGSDGPSILVEPFPNKLTQRLCEKHGFWLFEGTAREFIEEVNALAGPPTLPWATPQVGDSHLVALSRSEQLKFAATFERVPRNPTLDPQAGRFLLGAPLTWEMLAANVDIPRRAALQTRNRIVDAAHGDDLRVTIILDEPGTGKTAFLKRLAFDLSKIYNTVYWYSGQIFVEEEDASSVFDLIIEDVFVFVDNWADNQSYIRRVVANMRKRNVIFVGTERSYRAPYVETGMGDEKYLTIMDILPLQATETRRLVAAHDREGLSSVGGEQQHVRELTGEPIAIGACRIQNNYRPFDKIVDELLQITSRDNQKIYLTAAIARYCYSAGIRRRVLVAATDAASAGEELGSDGPLPLTRSSGFLSPKRSVVADRVVSQLIKKDRPFVVEAFIALARSLAPYVNRFQISNRSPEARLAGRLMDFDQVIKRLINDDAEQFYEGIRDEWSWNSRYWEQIALLKLDRYLVDQTDEDLLQAAIQHARHAYAIERHPLSLTTLAKILFTAMSSDRGEMVGLFNEAWALMKESIEIESRWDNIRATAFVVCFNGVISYVDLGGQLDGDQADSLRDMIAITHARKLHDRRLDEVRAEVGKLVGGREH